MRDTADPAVEFLSPYGLSNFPLQYVDALSALLSAQRAFDAGDAFAAKAILDTLWAQYPAGDPSWGSLPRRPFGINLGSPPCYYALRMLSDTADWHASHPGFQQALRTARLTVLLVGRSNGLEPRDRQELQQGTGAFVQHTLDPLLVDDDSAVVHQALELFRQYVVAMTGGALEVETRIRHLPHVDLAVEARADPDYAGLVNPGDVWPFVPAEDLESTDWWWILYPSHVPERHPAFSNAGFITGGMGVGPDSESPYFIVDDRWLVRKPPHLGNGPYTDVERRTYLPQWLQHEFFHHLFRSYPELGLESTPHQWFDRASWPADLQGRYEADYLHEALYRRLRGAGPPLVSTLRYATAGAPWSALTLDDVLGRYRRNPVQNDWHTGGSVLGSSGRTWLASPGTCTTTSPTAGCSPTRPAPTTAAGIPTSSTSCWPATTWVTSSPGSRGSASAASCTSA